MEDSMFGYVKCTAPSLSEKEKEGEALLNNGLLYKSATPLKMSKDQMLVTKNYKL